MEPLQLDDEALARIDALDADPASAALDGLPPTNAPPSSAESSRSRHIPIWPTSCSARRASFANASAEGCAPFATDWRLNDEPTA